MPRCANAQAHTQRAEGVNHKHRFNYAVKFYPDALVIPGSGDVTESSGTDGAPQSGRRRMVDVPGGTGGRPRRGSRGGRQFRTLFSPSIFVFRLPRMKRKQDNISEPLLSFWEHDYAGYK